MIPHLDAGEGALALAAAPALALAVILIGPKEFYGHGLKTSAEEFSRVCSSSALRSRKVSVVPINERLEALEPLIQCLVRHVRELVPGFDLG